MSQQTRPPSTAPSAAPETEAEDLSANPKGDGVAAATAASEDEDRAVQDASADAATSADGSAGDAQSGADEIEAAEQLPYRIPVAYPDGHFYSPVVNTPDIHGRQAAIWPAQPDNLGIAFNDDGQQRLLREVFPKHFACYDYRDQLEEGEAEDRYYTLNTQFGWLDSRVYFALLRHFRPRQVLEVGAGYSTLLATDVNRRFLGNSASVACIEPYPRPFLRTLDGLTELIEERVEKVPLQRFESLQSGDLLFIDSSHVAKTGSDVNHLYFEVLPRLRSGVLVHVHDIFFPHDYPPDWVLTENRSWNEQYLLRALLMDSMRYQVLFGCNYAHHHWPELVRTALNLPDGRHFGGSSFWMQVG